jgi:hypothetical protein
LWKEIIWNKEAVTMADINNYSHTLPDEYQRDIHPDQAYKKINIPPLSLWVGGLTGAGETLLDAPAPYPPF